MEVSMKALVPFLPVNIENLDPKNLLFQGRIL